MFIGNIQGGDNKVETSKGGMQHCKAQEVGTEHQKEREREREALKRTSKVCPQRIPQTTESYLCEKVPRIGSKSTEKEMRTEPLSSAVIDSGERKYGLCPQR